MAALKAQFPDEQAAHGSFVHSVGTSNDHVRRLKRLEDAVGMTHDEINPTRIVSIGSLQYLISAHDRERIGGCT
jgi:hypothetical protein